MEITEFKNVVASVLPQFNRGRPHKSLAVLAIIIGIERGIYRKNEFRYDQTFRTLFTQHFEEFSSPDDKNRPIAPFFHLRSHNFWSLIAQPGKEEECAAATTVGSTGFLNSIVDYAIIDQEMYDFLGDAASRKAALSWLISSLVSFYGGKRHPVARELERIPSLEQSGKQTGFKFETIVRTHEQEAMDEIRERLHSSVKLIRNHELYDPSTKQYLECDLIVIDEYGAVIVELKHWRGEIEINPYSWVIDGSSYRDDPHRSNIYKCKVLSAFIKKHLPTLNNIWVESVVVLTNPDSVVVNPGKPDARGHNLTFAGVTDLIKYFQNRSKVFQLRLNSAQGEMIVEKLLKYGMKPGMGKYQVDGYKIQENLTSTPKRVDMLGIRVGNNVEGIKRLRIFLDDPGLDAQQREINREKALNSLKAISAIGDHANILKVWSVPDADGRIIEASDWSDQGTLANYLAKKGRLELDEAIGITIQILRGLKAVHEANAIHRDLQPANILMVKDIPKLMNFDLSYILEDIRFSVAPETGWEEKTPYSAPELIEGLSFSESSDLFSVGVILFQALVGKTPFKLSTDLSRTDGHLAKDAIDELENVKVPKRLIEIINALVQKDRQKRPSEASRVLEWLQEVSGLQHHEQIEPIDGNRKLKPLAIHDVYEILEELGSGRDAQVYKARRMGIELVAIKLFNHEVDKDRIVQERQILSRLSSPYLVSFEGVNQWSDKRYFLTLGLVEGGSIRGLIENGVQPSLDIFRSVATKIMEAITTMHSDPMQDEPILHNDIKPENILINQSNDPVLIDFGAAGLPHIGPFMGTLGYVAPDTIDGPERIYSQDGDLFALGVTLFEWYCGVKPYEESPDTGSVPLSLSEWREDSPEKLDEWFRKAVSPRAVDRFENIAQMKRQFDEIFDKSPIGEELAGANDKTGTLFTKIEQYEAEIRTDISRTRRRYNHFVDYLNTLHNLTPANENALAESQALSPFFSSVQINMPIADRIRETLLGKGGTHVILTGHAGDGKSTIALQLYKEFKGLPMDEPLKVALRDREAVTLESGLTIHIVKDMSELSSADRLDSLEKATLETNGSERWLIISNTGALLATFDRLSERLGLNQQDLETELLEVLEKPEPQFIDISGARFMIVNLARVDNVNSGVRLLEKIIQSHHWNECDGCEVQDNCPIILNIKMMRDSHLFVDRVKAVYRYLYDYGKRLTMRQISSHLAYSLTSELDCHMSLALAPKLSVEDFDRYLFYNRFFGYQGSLPDDRSTQITAIGLLMPLQMGSRPFTELERNLYVGDQASKILYPLPAKELFESNVNKVKDSFDSESSNSSLLRQKIRRFVFLFCEMDNETRPFLPKFLGSEAVFIYDSWMPEKTLGSAEREKLLRKVMHVIQEQFTGCLLGKSEPGLEIFITAKRPSQDIRQSVQVLYAKVPRSSFELTLKNHYGDNIFRMPLLILSEQKSGARLDLDPPLLDFILMRSRGEIGSELNPSYFDRIYRFKSLVENEYRLNELELLKLNSNGSFDTIKFSIYNERLQVI